MTPGDVIKISALRAGDVFEWGAFIYQIGGRPVQRYPEARSAWSFTRTAKAAFELEDEVIYLGPLTAEMVKEILKK